MFFAYKNFINKFVNFYPTILWIKNVVYFKWKSSWNYDSKISLFRALNKTCIIYILHVKSVSHRISLKSLIDKNNTLYVQINQIEISLKKKCWKSVLFDVLITKTKFMFQVVAIFIIWRENRLKISDMQLR